MCVLLRQLLRRWRALVAVVAWGRMQRLSTTAALDGRGGGIRALERCERARAARVRGHNRPRLQHGFHWASHRGMASQGAGARAPCEDSRQRPRLPVAMRSRAAL